MSPAVASLWSANTPQLLGGGAPRCRRHPEQLEKYSVPPWKIR